MPTGRLPAPPLLSRSLLWQTYFLHISKLNKTIFSSARLAALAQPQDSRAWTAWHCLTEQGPGKRQKWVSSFSPMSEPVLNSLIHRDLPKPTSQHLMAGQEGDNQVWEPIWPHSPPQHMHTALRLRWEEPAEQKHSITAKSASSCHIHFSIPLKALQEAQLTMTLTTMPFSTYLNYIIKWGDPIEQEENLSCFQKHLPKSCVT